MILISIISVFSITQYNRSKTKSLTKTAKIQLGHLHRMEKLYFTEHSTFTFDLKGNMFPKGVQLYNVGFGYLTGDYKKNPCQKDNHDFKFYKNNYWELCGEKFKTAGSLKTCGFTNKHGNFPTLRAYKYIRGSRAMIGAGVSYLPHLRCNINLPTRVPYARYEEFCHENESIKKDYPGNEERYYDRFIAYAWGDIMDPKNFSSPVEKLDGWRINGSGYLEHCQDPLKNTSSCGTIMAFSEDNSDPYCRNFNWQPRFNPNRRTPPGYEDP